MVEKIQSTIAGALPLWKNHMVLALGIAHSQQALKSQQVVADATNTLLRKNSEMLKQSTVDIAKASERGIVDIDTILKANSDIIVTLDELLNIQAEGRKRCIKAGKELIIVESELKTSKTPTKKRVRERFDTFTDRQNFFSHRKECNNWSLDEL